eukprot:TRINITY_DN1525_c0_g2_i1.p1 TRINITY_DN1525_c0_g2~~TRINITY_DN1525_c0_g2_i1.p1  ORF type:complete len:643 (-),score=219.29 TRINITY_DN1525_c0_g2_i1:342-2270(-)
MSDIVDDNEFNFELVEDENIEEYILDEELIPFEDPGSNFQESVDTKDVITELLGDHANDVDNESEEMDDLYELPLDINSVDNHKKQKEKEQREKLEKEQEFSFEEEFVIGDEFLDDNIQSSYTQNIDEKDHINSDLLRGSFMNHSTSSFWNNIARTMLDLSLMKDDLKNHVEDKAKFEFRKHSANNLLAKLKELVEKSTPEPKFKTTCQVIGKNCVEFVKCCVIKDLRQMNWDNFNNSEENLSTKIALLTDFVQKRIIQENGSNGNNNLYMNKSTNSLLNGIKSKSNNNLIRSTTYNQGMPNIKNSYEDKNEVMSSTTNLILNLKPRQESDELKESDSNIRELLPVIKTWKVSIFDENEKGSYEKNREKLIQMMNLVCSQLVKESDELAKPSQELKLTLSNLVRSGDEFFYNGTVNSQNLIEQNMRITVNVLKEILQQKQIIAPSSALTMRTTTMSPNNNKFTRETKVVTSPSTPRLNNTNTNGTKKLIMGSNRSGTKKKQKKEIKKITNGTDVFRAINSRDLADLQKIIGTRGMVDLEIIDILGNTPLHIACKMASKEMIFYLLERGAQVNALNNQKKTPLHYLIERNEIQLARILIIQGAKKTERDRWGKTPLEYNSSFAEPLYNKPGSYAHARQCFHCT